MAVGGGQLLTQKSGRLRTTVFAPAKINLSLRITGVRPDGYHLLDSIMVPVSLFDRIGLELVPADALAVDCTTSTPDLPEDDSNLVVRAARLFCARADVRAAIRIDVRKHIPIGAGLGGGSSDAAATLVGLNHLSGHAVDASRLLEWAAELGADVPFFVVGQPARIRGVGESVERLNLPGKWPILLAFPGVSLSTREVYREFDRSLTSRQEDSRFWPLANGWAPLREMLINDLEAVASRMCPPVVALKRRLVERGAVAALMTGSGSAVFGVWERRDEAVAAAEELRVKDGMWARVVDMLERSPEVGTEIDEGE